MQKLTHTIEVMITKPKAWFVPISWMIRLFTWSKGSHCLYFFSEQPIWENRVFEIHFNEPRFKNDKYLDSVSPTDKYQLKISKWNYDNILGRAVATEREGKTKGYFVRLFGVAIAKMGGLILRERLGNPLPVGNAKMCSEYVFQDLMMTIYTYPYVAEFWRDRLKKSDTFSPKEMIEFLDHLIELSEKRPDLKEVLEIKKIRLK